MPQEEQPGTIKIKGGKMAIRFDTGYNAYIRKIVANYNQRRNRMFKAGIKQVPPHAKVSELKKRYDTRSELNRELERLKKLRRGDVLQKRETSSGAKISNWQYSYLKTNINSAREYYKREYKRVSKRVGRFPGERQYVDNMRAKIELLEMNPDYMSQSQLRSAIATIDEFAKAPSKNKAAYRGFLSEVEMVMDRLGISKEKKDMFFKKFEQLTPSQFLYAYDNSSIIGRIYELADSPKYGEEVELNTTDEDAENLINILMEEADDIILDAKANMD